MDARAVLPKGEGTAAPDPSRKCDSRVRTALKCPLGLDGVTVWPRIEALLSADERELLVDAKINLYVFVNGTYGALAVGICLVIDKAVYVPHPIAIWPLYAIPFVVAYALYRAAVSPAAEWGDAVRASIDLHRLDLYEKLGVRKPKSFSDERAMAVRVSQALLYGRPLLKDEMWRSDAADSEADPPKSILDLLETFIEWKGGSNG